MYTLQTLRTSKIPCLFTTRQTRKVTPGLVRYQPTGSSYVPSKFCKDCIHFLHALDLSGDEADRLSDHDKLRKGKCALFRVVDPVSGRVENVHAMVLRSGIGGCGIEGDYYQDVNEYIRHIDERSLFEK